MGVSGFVHQVWVVAVAALRLQNGANAAVFSIPLIQRELPVFEKIL